MRYEDRTDLRKIDLMLGSHDKKAVNDRMIMPNFQRWPRLLDNKIFFYKILDLTTHTPCNFRLISQGVHIKCAQFIDKFSHAENVTFGGFWNILYSS